MTAEREQQETSLSSGSPDQARDLGHDGPLLVLRPIGGRVACYAQPAPVGSS